MSVRVRALGAADAQAYWDVRYATLSSDPFAFGTTAERFAALPLEQVAERVTPSDTRVSFGAFLSGPDGQEALVGILTLVRLDSPGFAHRADVLGVAVLREARGQGAGDALMRAALDHARSWEGLTSLHLAVTDTQAAARRLYERHGFQVWGTQPDAIRRAGQVLQEHFMWRPL